MAQNPTGTVNTGRQPPLLGRLDHQFRHNLRLFIAPLDGGGVGQVRFPKSALGGVGLAKEQTQARNLVKWRTLSPLGEV